MTMALTTGPEALFLLAGRFSFGGILAFMGLGHFFFNNEQLNDEAREKGVPAAEFGVAASGVMLFLGGFGVLVGAYPVLSAGMLATFFLVVTPVMHDFWAVGENEMEEELAHLLKNAALFGTSLLFLALGGQSWGYAVDLGLWL